MTIGLRMYSAAHSTAYAHACVIRTNHHAVHSCGINSLVRAVAAADVHAQSVPCTVSSRSRRGMDVFRLKQSRATVQQSDMFGLHAWNWCEIGHMLKFKFRGKNR